jgi:hypothetical protein
LDHYRYRHHRIHLINDVSGLITMMVFIIVSVLSTLAIMLRLPEALGMICFPIMGFIAACGVLVLLTAEPEVGLDDDSITLLYVVGKIRIPWHSVQDIRPIGKNPGPRSRIAVCAQHITPVHYVHGWQWLGEFRPCFLISPKLERYEELAAKITERLQQNQLPAEKRP